MEHKTFSAQFVIRFDFVKLSGCRGGFQLRNQICHCKTVCIKRNLYLINYNRMRTQWTTKGNRDAGSSCSRHRGLHRYLRNFGGVWTPPPNPTSVRHCLRQRWPDYLASSQLYGIQSHSKNMESLRKQHNPAFYGTREFVTVFKRLDSILRGTLISSTSSGT